MTITVTGPDGSNVAFPDGTPHDDIVAAMDAHFGTGKAAPKSPGLIEGLGRSAAEGVPIAGGLLNKLDAATNAFLAPALDPLLPDSTEKLPEGSFAERYAHALRIQNEKSKGFEEAHPVLSGVAGAAGGIGAGGALLRTAPAVGARILGLTGETLPAQMVQGAASGAAIGGADAATRGEDIEGGAGLGALTGAGAPLLGRAIAKGVEAYKGMRAPVPVPTNTVDIAGVPVRRTVGQATGDTEAIQREQMALRGNDNSREQQVARNYFDAQKGELENAGQAVAAQMHPEGQVVAQTPQDAAQLVTSRLADNQRATTMAAERTAQAIANEGATLHANLGGQQLGQTPLASTPLEAAGVAASHIADVHGARTLAAQQAEQALARQGQELHLSLGGQRPGQMPLASSPLEAAGIVSHGVGQMAEQAQAAKNAAYQALGESDVVFHPAAFNGAGNTLRRMVDETSRIDINPEMTPITNAAANKIDSIVGDLAQRRDENGRIIASEPVTPAVIEDIRKRLNVYMGQARAAAQSGKPADAVAMRDLIDSFDDLVQDRIERGTVIHGDPAQALDLMKQARAANTAYRRTYTSQGAGDQVGQAMQNIIGRYDGQAMPPEQVRSTLYGNGPLPIKIAQRFKDIFGNDSQEVGAIKQGYFAHLTQDALGRPLDPEVAADNLQKATRGTLGQTYFNPAERERLNAHAERLRSSVPADANHLDTNMRRVAAGEVNRADLASKLFESDGGRSEQTIASLRQTMSPEQFGALKQGYFAHLTHDATGRPLEAGKAADNLQQAMRSALGQNYFSEAERTRINAYAERLRASIRAKPTDVDTILQRLGSGQMNASDLVSMLNTNHGGGRNERLVAALKQQLSPQDFAALKQGQWAWLKESHPNAGPLDVGSRQVVTRIRQFLDGPGRPVAEAMFSPEERSLLRVYADFMHEITPPAGTVNYSNTGSVIGKMARGALDNIFGGLGMVHGVPGMIVGHGADLLQRSMRDAIRAAKVAKLLYGTPQGVNAIADLQRQLSVLASFGARTTTPALTH